MRYQRTFRLQASHFNSKRAYEIAWRFQGPVKLALHLDDIHFVLGDVHGHNFRVIVVLDGEMAEDWLIDDVALAKVVMAWDNRNISMHPDFYAVKKRATTEKMASVLWNKLLHQFGPVVKGVTIYETDDIYASTGAQAT